MTKAADTSLRSAWIATALFTVIYTLHSVDRFVISVVVEPIRHEFHLTDGQLGALAGLAHAIAYSAFVLPVGWLLDRHNRVRLLALMLGIWSAITMLGAAASGFWFLFLARMGVGAAESTSSPAIVSLVSSLFPAKGRASAMGVVFSGVAIGTGLVFAVGGMIADNLGWRYVFLIAGLPGVVLAVIVWFTVREPERRRLVTGEVASAPPMLSAIAFALRTPAVVFNMVGLTLVSVCVASVWTWITPILIRQHDFSLTEAGFVVGLAAGVAKFASTAASGFLADWIAKGRVTRLWIVPTCALTLSLPAAIALELSSAHWLVVALTMLLGFTLGTHYAAPRAVIASATPDRMRGSVASVEQLMVNLLGAGCGPLITGLLSEYLGGKNSVGMALIATLTLNLFAALCFWLGARRARDVEEEVAPDMAAAS